MRAEPISDLRLSVIGLGKLGSPMAAVFAAKSEGGGKRRCSTRSVSN